MYSGADSRTYTAVIIGLGRIGSLLDDPWADRTIQDESWRPRPCTHAGQFSAHPRVRLVGGADPNPTYRSAFTRRWQAPAFADHRELLRQTQPDIVSVCTRAVDRPGPTLDAIAAGAKALLLEKHPSATLQEADEMLAAATQAGIPVIVNQTFRFDPEVRSLAEEVRRGRIGQLRSIVAYPGARLVHSGVHFFDLFRFFGAGEPVAVFGRLETGADDDDPPGSGYVEFNNGVRAYIDARSRVAHGYLELHGTTGVARVGNDASCTIALWDLPAATSATDRFYQPRLHPGMWRPVGNPGAERLTNGRNITNLCVDEVLACLDEHRPSISSLEDALRAQEIATAIYASHYADGQLVSLPLQQRDLALRAI